MSGTPHVYVYFINTQSDSQSQPHPYIFVIKTSNWLDSWWTNMSLSLSLACLALLSHFDKYKFWHLSFAHSMRLSLFRIIIYYSVVYTKRGENTISLQFYCLNYDTLHYCYSMSKRTNHKFIKKRKIYNWIAFAKSILRNRLANPDKWHTSNIEHQFNFFAYLFIFLCKTVKLLSVKIEN